MFLQVLRTSFTSRGGRLLAPWLTVLVAGIIAPVAYVAFGPSPAEAAPVNLSVHVHDDYYHPAGTFIVGPGTDHTLAKAACEAGDPSSSCSAVIQVGGSITWVSPAPLAANPHTVTECTDNTFSVCGAGVSASNPIEDSGFRAPPSPGPSGWPYGPVQFTAPGTYYYLCTVHPTVMRGRVIVLAHNPGVGGVTEYQGSDVALGEAPASVATDDNSMVTSMVLLGGIAVVALAVTGTMGVAFVRVRNRR